MSETPIISVVMPVYNAEKYVAEAVESILNQTFSDFEFLIVNDGSSDGSLAILKRYAEKDRRIRLISRPNTGLVVALNEMLSKSKGEFLARMDADDIALPDRFARQVEFLQRESDVVCVGGARELIDEEGRTLTYIEDPEHNDRIQELLLAGHSCICHPSAMIRRSALLKVGGYDESMHPAEDLDLWLRLGEVGKLANLKDKVVKYRLHQNSASEQNQTLQRNNAQRACERAWQRRGIEGRYENTESWRPGADRTSRHHFMLRYGWWAFNSGQRQTAIVYGTRAIAALPFAVEGWKLLACGLIKPLPKSDSK
jgi:glycosyltransferase involved in cell wall biosynthesis